VTDFKRFITVSLLVVTSSLFCVFPTYAQTPAIDDPAITNRRLANGGSDIVRIEGTEVEAGFNKETVVGAIMLTVWKRFPSLTVATTYRFLGQEGLSLRFNVETELEHTKGTEKRVEKSESYVISLPSREGRRFTLIPHAYQFTKIYFELIALPETGFVGAIMRSDGPPR